MVACQRVATELLVVTITLGLMVPRVWLVICPFPSFVSLSMDFTLVTVTPSLASSSDSCPFCHLHYKNHFVPLLPCSLKSTNFLAYAWCSQQNCNWLAWPFQSRLWRDLTWMFSCLAGSASTTSPMVTVLFAPRAFLCLWLLDSHLFCTTQLRSHLFYEGLCSGSQPWLHMRTKWGVQIPPVSGPLGEILI